MTDQFVLDLTRQALMVALQLAAPFLVAALVIGLIVGLIQSLTQIQEQTLAFVPKLVIIGQSLVLFPYDLHPVKEACRAVGATLVYSGIVSFALLKLVDKLVGLRVPEDHEISGLDLSQHSETAYSITGRG